MKPKFKVGQVVAECYDFQERKGFYKDEYVRSYFVLDADLCRIYNRDAVREKHPDGTAKRYYRALNERELGQ